MKKMLFYVLLTTTYLSIGSCQNNTNQPTSKNASMKEDTSKVNKKNEDWKKELTPEQDAITFEGNTEGKTMNENMTQVKLTAKAEIIGMKLNVSYEAENLSSQDLYLWDGMIGFNGPEQVIDHDRAYVFFEEPNTVRLIRANLPLPTTFKIGKKQILFARLLKARSALSATFSMPYPVREHSPYYEALKDDERELKKCSKIHLMVGWTPPKQGMTIDEQNILGEKWFKIRGLWESPYQEVAEQVIPLKTELLIYTTPFERQTPFK